MQTSLFSLLVKGVSSFITYADRENRISQIQYPNWIRQGRILNPASILPQMRLRAFLSRKIYSLGSLFMRIGRTCHSSSATLKLRNEGCDPASTLLRNILRLSISPRRQSSLLALSLLTSFAADRENRTPARCLGNESGWDPIHRYRGALCETRESNSRLMLGKHSFCH